jgi:hypothetical protein
MGTSTSFAYNLTAGQRQLKGWILPCPALPAQPVPAGMAPSGKKFQLANFAGYSAKKAAGRPAPYHRVAAREGAAKKGAAGRGAPFGIANASQ